MRRVIDRMVLGLLLCTVTLTTSGCFLRLVLGGVVVESLSEEVDLVIASISANASAAVCRVSPYTGALECTYVIEDPDGFLATTTSTAQLVSEFGLFGAFIDPLILQVPAGLNGVSNVTGTVDDPANADPPVPLVITTTTSFFAQPGTEVVAEPGHVFIIVDFPQSIASLLTTTGKDLRFTFQFQLLSSVGQFSSGLPVKAMLAGKVEAGGQTFYPPMLPCATSFAGLPTVTIPIGGPVNLFARIVTAFSQQNLACNNAVYDFTSVGAPTAAGHFQCYAARDRRGSLCGPGSPQNTGAACTTETECGGVEDETAFCVPNGFPRGVRVSLSDQFESGLFDVKGNGALCNPADKNGEGISDPLTHLRSYRIEAAPGQTPHARRTGLRIENQFHPSLGELLVDTTKPDRLLVPTAASLTQPVPAPDPASHGVDHYKCYKVKPSRGTSFQRINDVSVLDQHNHPGVVDVVQPLRLCTPVSKNNEAIKNDAGHLMCYKVVPVKRTKRVDVLGIFLSNQFGSEQIDTGKELEFCVPSVKILP